MRQRVQQLQGARDLSDEDLLLMAVQETLALQFGADIASHPAFDDVTRKIRDTLAGTSEFRQLLPLLRERTGPAEPPA